MNKSKIQYPSNVVVALCIILYLLLTFQSDIRYKLIPLIAIGLCILWELFCLIKVVLNKQMEKWISQVFVILSYIAILYLLFNHIGPQVLGAHVDL